MVGGLPFDELDRATPAMLKAWFRAYPIDGHTMRKAISFFINAAKEAELPMSNAIRKMAKSRRRGPSTNAPSPDKHDDAGGAPSQPTPEISAARRCRPASPGEQAGAASSRGVRLLYDWKAEEL